jgi:antitoxin YefM
VILISAHEWESIQETLLWLSEPDIHASVAEARVQAKPGEIFSEEQIRTEFGVPHPP